MNGRKDVATIESNLGRQDTVSEISLETNTTSESTNDQINEMNETGKISELKVIVFMRKPQIQRRVT